MLYVGVGTAVQAYRVNTDGSLIATGTISGPATGLQNVTGLATDRSGNIYVTTNLGSAASIEEFAIGSVGNVAPTLTLSGTATELSAPHGLDIDDTGNIFVANYSSNSVNEYAAGSSGNAAPIGTIGSPSVAAPLDVKVDHADRLFVTHGIQNGGPDGAVVLTSISSQTAAFVVPNNGGAAGIALASNGDVYLANNNGVGRYAAPFNGTSYSSISSVSPSGALGIAIDTSGRIFVATGGDFTSSLAGTLLLEYAPELASTTPTLTAHVAGWSVAVFPKP